MKRNTKITAIVPGILALAVGVLAWLNAGNIEEKKAFQEGATFLVSTGNVQHLISMDDIMKIRPRAIIANHRSGGQTRERQFTAVSLKSLLDHLGADYSSARNIVFTAADGYSSAVPLAEALDEDNCLIVFEEAGVALGTRESGGEGPYMMILAKDQFSQRWVKFLLEIRLN